MIKPLSFKLNKVYSNSNAPVIELIICAFLGYKLFVIAALDDASEFQNHNGF